MFSGSIHLFLAFGCPRMDPWIDKDRVLLLLLYRDRSLLDEGSILDVSTQKITRIAQLFYEEDLQIVVLAWNDPFLFQKTPITS